MPETSSVTFRAETDLVTRLEKLAAATDRSKSWHVEQALKTYLALQAWQVERIGRGLDDLAAGRTVEHDKVVTWLEGWGGANETEAPR